MYNILNKLIEFQQKNPDIYIGGSVSLMLQNVIPYRVPKDIDIITPNKTHIYDIFNVNKNKYFHIRQHKYNDLKWELFYNPNSKYIYYSDILKISPVDEIMEWKYKFQKIKPNDIKNNNDIIYHNQWQSN